MQTKKFPSIHDHVPPLEVGGITARQGFTFQDHVAVKFCLQMFNDTSLVEVRCESQDDITLIWHNAEDEEKVEFVQVKGNKLDQLWSVAKICERKDNKVDSSIIEKLFANDRFEQESRFRIITRRGINKDMAFFSLPDSSPLRSLSDETYITLCKEIEKRIPNFKSPKGNSSKFCVFNTLWEVEHSTESVKDKNIKILRKIFEQEGSYLFSNQEEKIYTQLLQKVRDIAESEWKVNPEAKKLKRNDFITWLKAIISGEALSSIGPIEKLKQKMEDASLPPDYLLNARLTYRSYRQETLRPKYLDVSERELLESEVSAILQSLRSQLDAGTLNLSSIEFHNECLQKLEQLRVNLPIKSKPSFAFLQGCMYFITGRCGHRFRRIEL